MWRKVYKVIKALALLAVLVAGATVAVMVFRPLADKRQQLEEHRDAFQQDNDIMAAEIAFLKKQQDMFIEDPDFVEQVGRRENRIRSNELVFVFPRENPAAEAP